MRCSKCGVENPVRKKFCGDCGAPLANLCPKCGADNPAGKRFCGECGTALGAQTVAAKSDGGAIRVADSRASENVEGERRTVTVLSADIRGSTELEQDLDPEEARAVIDPALKLMIDAVHHYGGHVVQSTGDGIFAMFGAPIAHEDHPQRALHAALRIQRELKLYSGKVVAEGGIPIEARIGVTTGEVVTRSIKTGEAHTEYSPIGHTANLAARMQAVAPTGSIAVSETTRKLCEGYFSLRPLGPTKVKGVSEPVNVYEVTGLGPIRTRLQRAAGRGYTKFVGRQREMEAMKHAAELAKARHGQIVAVVADAGVGKSRLFYEFKAKNQSGWLVLEAVSVTHGKASAYLPLIDLLHGYFEIAAEDDTRRRRQRLLGKLLDLDRSLEDALPYLFALLGIVDGEDPLAQMDAQIRRRRTQEAVKRILLRESLNQPLVLVFEDLHWIDEETLAFLNLLAEGIANAPVLLLVNYRPEYSHSWGSKTYYTQLRVDPLAKESAGDMLSALVGDSSELTPLKQLVLERTDGNPLFMEELIEALFEEGVLVRNGAVKLTRPLSQLKIPPTVQGILASRIDRLPPEAKDLLQTLAVIGMEFPLSLVRKVVQQLPDRVDHLLGNLQTSEFIYEQPAAGDVEYRFKHALTHQAACDALLTERRKLLHERAGQAIEALYAEHLDDHYAELARHFLLGNDLAKALSYTRLASAQAVSRAAYSEASSLIDAGIRLLDKLPDDRTRLEAELWLRTVESTVAFVRFGASSQQRERAIRRRCELSEKIGERKQLLHAMLTLSNLYFAQGEAARGLELARRCLPLAEATQDPALLADAHWAAANSAHTCGELAEAVVHFDEAIRCADRAPDAVSVLGFLLSTAPLSESCAARHIVGRIGEAAALAEEAIKRAREPGHLFSLGLTLTMAAGWTGYLRREPQKMLVYADEQIAFSAEHGLVEWLHWGRIFRGQALADLGQLEEGVAEMEAGIEGFRSRGAPLLQFSIAVLAFGYAKLARTEEAVTTLNEVLGHVERSGEKGYSAEILRLKGEVLLMGEPSATAEAESCLRDAVEVARRQGARCWQLRATTSLARLLRDTNRRDEARTMLAEIYNWFTEGFDTADLKEAKALLDQLSG